MEKMTYIVIDESGAMHQKENDYFVIAGFITKQIYSIKSRHKKVEKEMREKYSYLNRYSELKGLFLNSKQKIEILSTLLESPTLIPIAIIVDKKHMIKRNNHNENIKYNYFLQLLLHYLLVNYANLFLYEKIELILDNRNVSVGSLNSLQDYLNAELGLVFDKQFKVYYKNSKDHREVQVADLIANTLFGYYNYRTNHSTYKKISAFKNTIISKFPYKEFEEPKTLKIIGDNDKSV